MDAVRQRRFPPMRFWAGFAIVLLSCVCSVELFLRRFPPEDLQLYLRDHSPKRGGLVPDETFGVRFESMAGLIADNPTAFGPGSIAFADLHPNPGKPVWLVIGSSFGFNVARRLNETETDHFTLVPERREMLHVRMALAKAVFEFDMRVDRVVLVLTPGDFRFLGENRLARHTANAQGGAVFDPRLPPEPLASLASRSRLAFSLWAGTGRQVDFPRFRVRHLSHLVPPGMREDLDHMFAGLKQVERRRRRQITLVPIPMRDQTLKRDGFAIEDALVELAKKHELEIVDPRPAFTTHPRPADLYIADGHLSREGDDLVLRELREYDAGTRTHALSGRGR